MSNCGATQREESGKKAGKASGNNPAIVSGCQARNQQHSTANEYCIKMPNSRKNPREFGTDFRTLIPAYGFGCGCG
jgi:hypothetical protein